VTAILDRGSDLFPFRSVQPEPEGEQEIDWHRFNAHVSESERVTQANCSSMARQNQNIRGQLMKVHSGFTSLSAGSIWATMYGEGCCVDWMDFKITVSAVRWIWDVNMPYTAADTT
jgi:hypothetical protein